MRSRQSAIQLCRTTGFRPDPDRAALLPGGRRRDRGSPQQLLSERFAGGVSPNSTATRQTVLDRAGETSRKVPRHRSRASATRAPTSTGRSAAPSIRSTNCSGQIRDFNVGRSGPARTRQRTGRRCKPAQHPRPAFRTGRFQGDQNPDNSLTILLGGSEPAVIGEHIFPISSQTAESGASLWSAQGKDLTPTSVRRPVGRSPRAAEQVASRLRGRSRHPGLVVHQPGQPASVPGPRPERRYARSRPVRSHRSGASGGHLDHGFRIPDRPNSRSPTEGAGGNGNAIRLARRAEQQFDSRDSAWPNTYGNIGANVGRDLNEATTVAGNPVVPAQPGPEPARAAPGRLA